MGIRQKNNSAINRDSHLINRLLIKTFLRINYAVKPMDSTFPLLTSSIYPNLYPNHPKLRHKNRQQGYRLLPWMSSR